MKTMRIFFAAVLMALGMTTAQAQHCGHGKKAAIENILTRTSIRKYQDRAIEAGKIDTLLRAAMAAPTAVNKQPWHFVVVTDKQKIAQLGGDRFGKAPLAIVVCGDMEKALEGPGRDFWIQDVSAATENLLLAAHALGLGAVWTGGYPRMERCANIAAVIGTPEYIIPLCVVYVGYPDEQPEPKQKFKTENVSWNAYGNAHRE